MIKASTSFLRVLVDCTKRQDLAKWKERYQFMGVPAVCIVSPAGEVVEKVVGETSADGFLKRFAKYGADVAPTSAPPVKPPATTPAQDEAQKKILDRIQKELEDSSKRLRDDIAKIIREELAKSGVAKTTQPKPPPKSFEAQMKDFLPKLSDAGVTGRLKKFLATPAGLEFAQGALKEQGVETLEDALDMFFEDNGKGKFVLRAEFETQIEELLDKSMPADPPVEPQPDRKPAYLGISPDDFSDDQRKELGLSAGVGIKLYEVKPGSSAEKAGLKAGDVVVKIGGKDVSETSIAKVLEAFRSGDSTEIVFLRDGKRRTVKVTFGERK